MRLLHTSDWHLGINSGPVSRGPDHDYFLEWLENVLRKQSVDVLVIAGDIFDSMQPSSDALSRYYGFLARAPATGLRHVIVVGGNHDSPARLDAPSEVLQALNVHVVGGILSTEESWERCLVPLDGPSGDIEAVAIAVPYIHEFRLGIRTTDLDRAATREVFRSRFTELYAHLTTLAEERWPGVPIFATGHLTIGAYKDGDFPRDIHQVGTIEGLPASVLDPRLCYVALGHIHRSYPIDPSRRAWYAGSPIPLSLPESQTSRRALLVDLPSESSGSARVEPLDIPCFRGLLELRDTPQNLLQRIKDLTWTEALPPLLFCRAVTDALPSDLSTRLHGALERGREKDAPALVELRQERSTPIAPREDEGPPPDLCSLTPMEVFERLCQSKGRSDTAALNQAFAQISSVRETELQAIIDAIGGDNS